jgi:hypothetical protein
MVIWILDTKMNFIIMYSHFNNLELTQLNHFKLTKCMNNVKTYLMFEME